MSENTSGITLGEVDRRLKRAGLTLQVSHSTSQYHAYLHRQGVLVGFERRENLEQAIERALKAACPAEPIGAVPELQRVRLSRTRAGSRAKASRIF